MQDLEPMRPTVVAPNCFGMVPLNAVAAMSPTAAASMGQEVAANYHLSEHLVGGHEC
jgi:hypothetical protein